MKQAIVIYTHHNAPGALENCLNSLRGYFKYPIIILYNDDWEIGCIKWMYKHTDYDEFFLMQDTVEIKDTAIFDILFEQWAGVSICVAPKANSYLVKYCREDLNKINIPTAHNKREAVNYEWDFWNYAYFVKSRTGVASPFILDSLGPENVFEEKFGKMRQKLENKYLIKYKGTWLPEMIE